MEDTLCDTASHYFLCTLPKLQPNRVILYSEAMCRAFANCKDSLLPGTCKSISFLKTRFSKQFFKKAILDIAVAIIIPLHESAGNQLHPIAYQDQPHWHVWPQILNYAGTPTVSVVHEDLPPHGAKHSHHPQRTWDGEWAYMHHDPSSSVLPSRWTRSMGPRGGTVPRERVSAGLCVSTCYGLFCFPGIFYGFLHDVQLGTKQGLQ